MKQAHSKRASQNRPKHKHTKEYLKHYYPFLPLLLSIGVLITTIFAPLSLSSDQIVRGRQTDSSENQLFLLTNQARQINNQQKLDLNQQLSTAANAKAKDMVRRNYWSHNTPEGNEPWSFITEAGYKYQQAGENLAYGFTTDEETIQAWLNSQSHRENILNEQFTEVGFGTANSTNFEENGAAQIVVAMYASPRTASNETQETSQVLGAQKQIAYIESITGISWMTTILSTLVGITIVYLLASHTLAVKKVLVKSEKFISRHPLTDSVIVLVLATGVVLLRTSGTIL